MQRGQKCKILVLFAHPALHKSRVNRLLFEAIQNVDGITVHDLYEVYPDLIICSDSEQQMLREHDLIVFQHPFFWYSSPAILKEWMDLVLEYGFAYGTGGTALAGKKMMNAITTGGPQESYLPTGFNRFTVRQFLLPFEQTAALCGMEYLPPHVIHSAPQLNLREQGKDLASRYRLWLESLRDDAIHWEKYRAQELVHPEMIETLIQRKASHGT